MRVSEFLGQHQVPFEILKHEDVFSAQRLAHELHVSGRNVAKTVLLRANHGFEYILAVLPATMEVDLTELSRLLAHSEIALATEIEMSERFPDCDLGVLPPFGSQYGLKTMMDESLAQSESIIFESNSAQEAIRMKLDDFMRLEEPLLLRFATHGRSASRR